MTRMGQGNFQRRTDADGVVWIEEPGRPRLRAALGVLLVAALGLLGFWFLRPPHEQAPPEPPPAERAPETPRSSASRPPPPARDPMERAMHQALEQHPLPPPEEEAEPPPGSQQEITVEQLPPGDGTGIHAFPRPGTKPLRGGIIVPDGYTLPPGYLRHYQTTDDGEQLPPILTFHPDYHPVGADGQPLAIPPDRIVPRELAPFGMPVRWLDPPPVRKERK